MYYGCAQIVYFNIYVSILILEKIVSFWIKIHINYGFNAS